MIYKSKYLVILCFSSLFAACQNNTKLEQTNIRPHKVEKEIESESVLIDTSSYTFYWKENYQYHKAIINNIDVPDGYKRISVEKNSFGDWLRHLPLKDNNTVYLYNGEKKYNQQAQYRVIDIDVGNKDLQQCADAVMRLRAEYLYSVKKYNKINFNYTNGTNIPFSKWSSGFYPSLIGNKVVWTNSSKNNNSYQSFKKYMTNIFMYAGTASLEKEMITKELKDIEPGDVFIKGGFPGHAVLVIDVAVNVKTGNRIFMLAQSYMPAQDIHLLHNFKNEELSPWYSVEECVNRIYTPEWTFELNQLRSFTK